MSAKLANLVQKAIETNSKFKPVQVPNAVDKQSVFLGKVTSLDKLCTSVAYADTSAISQNVVYNTLLEVVRRGRGDDLIVEIAERPV